MCGIYGATIKYSSEILSKKLNRMKFRGPDHIEYQTFNTLSGKQISLGHVRLAIMDIDKRSNQPFNYSKDLTIVFNGEIYNFQELKSRFFSNRQFRTTSDTEVLCAMYEKFGKDSLSYLNGMFSFVIYDKQKQILFGARDRLGKKPFYYWHSPQGFEFCSQLAPIAIGNDFTVSSTARQLYLLHSYIPDPWCIYEDIKKLEAGCFFEYDMVSNNLKIERYWNLFDNSCHFIIPKNYYEAKEQVRELLFDSVKIRLNSDVPVGTYLSGGIDSSLVTAVVSRLNKNVHSYTIGFTEPEYDESNFAKNVAQAIGIPIKINYCEGSDMLSIMRDYTYYYDEPFADFSLIPTSLLAQVSRRDVTVALGGDGGDELFFGYPHYSRLMSQLAFYKKVPNCCRKLIYKSINKILPSHLSERIKYESVADYYVSHGIYCNFYGAEKYDALEVARNIPNSYFLYNERGVLCYSDYDMKTYMNSCINTKTDRATMRSSLELRSPIMDYRLAEYSRLLPVEYFHNKGLGYKRLLKDILYDMVPRNLLERPKKGFAAPIGKWLRDDLKDEFYSLISKENFESIIPELDFHTISKLVERFKNGERLNECTFWSLYNYMKWYKNR